MRPASVGFHCPECTKRGAQRVYRPGDLVSQPTITFAIIGICVAAYVAQVASNDRVTTDFLLWGPAVATGDWWRLITGGFLHSGILHIGFNMYALYVFGPVLEKAIGPARFAIVYAGGLLAGSLAVMAFNFGTPTLGASGAVLGLAGGVAAVMGAQGRSILRSPLAGIFLINLLLPLVPGFRISFWGHLGGIAGGYLTVWILLWVPRSLRQTKQAQQVAIAAAIGLVIVFGVAGVLVARQGGLVTVG
jgi:membrane associated rhomboid family serine protease